MRLIIAEKRSVGNAYASALGADKKHDGYIESEKDVITWCIGHLVELANAEVYDERYKKWNIADLPIIPKEWKYVVSSDKIKQFEIVKKLMHDPRITEVIIATDAGREGELIGRLTYEKASCTKPIKRAWLSSLTETAIVEAFNNLRDGAEYDNLYYSALCRAQADWEVGVSATRAFTKLYNKKLNVGRVQTPTLAMLCERNNAISNFVKEKYFNVKLNEIAVSEKLKTADEAEKIKADCDNKKAVVTSVKREKKTVNPPKLYDLTTLQREANRLYGFTAQQTLDYAQSLYESRIISYPRSDSQYLPDDMAGAAGEIIGIILEKIPQYNGFSYTPSVERIINEKFVTDHYGLIPTAELAKANLDNLPDGERKILELIANKLLCATADKHEYEAVTATLECGGYFFTAKGKSVINDGWKAIERLFKGQRDVASDTDSDEENTLELTEGQEIDNAVCTVSENFTKPKPHYTEDTLLSAMQTAGADEVTEDVERKGLGTPATRASIIEKLIKSGFIKREKKNIIVTAEGAELISLMPECIKSAAMTAEWENNLSLVAKGELSPDEFMRGIENLVNEIISSAKANVNPEKIAKFENTGEVIGKCPRCKSSDVRETPKAYSCELGAASACGFILWKQNKFFENAKKEFTKEIATALINKGKAEVNGLYSQKSGKTYNAVVCLDDTNPRGGERKYVNFKLEFPKKPKGGR